MVSRYEHNGITWIDLLSPTEEEIRPLLDEFGIHPFVAEELLLPTMRPKVDVYEKMIYLVLHFPADKHTYSTNRHQEMDFILGNNFIITAHYDTIDPVHKFVKEFETNQRALNHPLGNHSGHIFYLIIKKLYKALEHELEYIESTLGSIEVQIFVGKEKEMVRELSNTARILLDFKQAITPHHQVLNSLEQATKTFFGESFLYPMKNIFGEYYRVMAFIDRQRETLSELRETNNSLLTTKQNEVMKILTIMAFVTFPLSLIATIFGMNTTSTPVVGIPNDFYIVILIMALLTMSFFIFFKHKKWL